MLLIVAAVLVLPAASHAELRTGQARVHFPDKTSSSFPGLKDVKLAYDDVAGTLTVVADLRSTMADPAKTSALRSTQIDIPLGNFWGSEGFPDSCEWFLGKSVLVHMELGNRQASVEGAQVDPAELVISSDRRTVAASFTGTPALVARNLVCIDGSMTGPGIIGSSAATDYADGELLDGFGGADGDIGLYAGDDTEAQLRYVYNSFVRRKDEIFDDKGWAGHCSPTRSVLVHCEAHGRIRSVVGAPMLMIRGRRVYETHRAKSPFGPADFLRWRQHMRVRLTWKHCPSVIDAHRHRTRRSCSIGLTWRTRESLPSRVSDAIASRIRTTGDR